jgi:hypothetical protein
MTDAAATTHSSATIQHVTIEAAHDSNDTQQTLARQRTRRRTIAAVVQTGLTSAIATTSDEVTSGRDAKHTPSIQPHIKPTSSARPRHTRAAPRFLLHHPSVPSYTQTHSSAASTGRRAHCTPRDSTLQRHTSTPHSQPARATRQQRHVHRHARSLQALADTAAHDAGAAAPHHPPAAVTALPSCRCARRSTSPTRRRRRQTQRGAADTTAAATAARGTTPRMRRRIPAQETAPRAMNSHALHSDSKRAMRVAPNTTDELHSCRHKSGEHQARPSTGDTSNQPQSHHHACPLRDRCCSHQPGHEARAQQPLLSDTHSHLRRHHRHIDIGYERSTCLTATAR